MSCGTHRQSKHEKLKPNETVPKLEEICKDREKQGDDGRLTADEKFRCWHENWFGSVWFESTRFNDLTWTWQNDLKKSCYDSKLGDTWYLLHLKLNQSSVAEDMLKHVCCRRSSKDSLRWFLLIRYYYHVPWEYSYTHRTTATATRVFLWRPLSLFQSWQFSNVFTNIHSCSNRLISWSAAFFFTNSSHIAHLRRCKDSAVPYFLGIYVGSVNPILRGDS